MSAAEREALRSLLPEHALGLLGAEDARRVEDAVAEDASLAAELAEWRETVAVVPLALEPVPPPRELWERIVLSTRDSGAGERRPYAAFVDVVAKALEVGREAARGFLDRIDLVSSWVAGPSPQAQLFHIEPHPRIVAAGGLAGFVKVAPGARFPRHTHVGDEQVIVIAGGFLDEDGRIVKAGEESRHGAGTDHDFVALGDEPLIYLAVLRNGGVDFGSGFQL